MSAFNHFNQESIQIGDKAFYTLKESDINNPTKRNSNEQSFNLKEQPDQKKSKQSGKCKEMSVDDAVSENFCTSLSLNLVIVP